MKKLDNILKRNSARLLQEPYPTKVEMNNIYKAALRAPDHAWLRPTSFIEIKDKGIEKLSKIFVEFASKNVDQKNIEKYKNAPYRAPMIIAIVNTYKEHPKVPKIEQMLSTAASVQNILLALNALKYSSIWRTGKVAFNKFVDKKLGLKPNQTIVGFIYVGKNKGKQKNIPKINSREFVKYL